MCSVTAIHLKRQLTCTGNGHAPKSLIRKHNGKQFSHPNLKITALSSRFRRLFPIKRLMLLPAWDVRAAAQTCPRRLPHAPQAGTEGSEDGIFPLNLAGFSLTCKEKTPSSPLPLCESGETKQLTVLSNSQRHARWRRGGPVLLRMFCPPPRDAL